MRPVTVPDELDIDPFYKKYVDADGIPVVSSENVADEALMRARSVILQMLSKRSDIHEQMVKRM